MQAVVEKSYGNVLCVKFNVTSNTNINNYYQSNTNNLPEISPEYFINDFASFQVQLQYPDIYVKFVKLHTQDTLNYQIKVSCDQFQIQNKTFDGCGAWHLLHSANQQNYTFELTVYLEVLPFTNSFASLHADTELTDFELRCEDGSVEIHKVVLAVSSPVFRKMVSGNWREAKDAHVYIKDTSKTTLQDLKNYMYLHTLPDTGLEQLLLLASCYMMPDLEQKCVDKLVLNMTAQNAVELLKFATAHQVSTLMLTILEIVQNGGVKVKEIREYLLVNKHK